MKKVLLFTCFLLFFSTNYLFSQVNEYYLSIKIEDYSAIDELTRIVSIDKVSEKEVIAYANDTELAKLQKTGYRYELREHPSSLTGKSVTMATTVEQMADWDKYPTYDVYCELMQKFEDDYPNLCKLENIGTSVQNRTIWVLKISNNINADEPKPEILFSSSMHGDETTGWILCMRLADYLLSNYGTDDRITEILNSTSLYIAPNTNPDGTYYSGNHTVINSRRYNSNGVDLNRDYPDPRVGANTPYAKETQVMMDFADNHHFSLAINYHGGTEVVNYPWDAWRSSDKTHADNDWYIQASRQYATLAQENGPAGYFTAEDNGITNGGDWYVVSGGRQDYMNYWHHCREFTLEVSYVKLLDSDRLPDFWNYNKEAMLSFIENINQGVRGIVTNTDGEPLEATITVVGYDRDNSHIITNPSHGNYYRMVAPGSYTLKFESYAHVSQTISDVVVTQNNITPLNLIMDKEETYSLSGTVKSSDTGLHLEGVVVAVTNALLSAITNSEGKFEISGIAAGEYLFTFDKEDYSGRYLNLTIGDNIDGLYVMLNLFEGFSFEDEIVPEGFSFSGDLPWFITDSESYDGSKSIRSGAITHSQSSVMQYTFDRETDGEITFYAKISTEAVGKYDYLEFFIDNESKGYWYGEIDWQKYSFPITSGTHTLKWIYLRDYIGGGGSNAVWVDFISIPQSESPVLYVSPQNIELNTEDETGAISISIQNLSNEALNFNATIEDETEWLYLSDFSGTLDRDEIAEINANYEFTDFGSGTYQTTILIDIVDGIVEIPVSIDYQAVSSGITRDEIKLFSIHPNPASENIIISTNEATNVLLEVYSISGHKLSDIIISGTKTALELSEIGISSPGLYIFKLKAQNSVKTLKLMVK